MFGISGTELVIILLFGFLIFGPEKLPQMGRTVGRAIRQFRNASEAANKKFKEEVADPFQDAIAPYKDQVEESTKPLQEDIAAINQTLNETKSMFTDPFKDMFSPTPAKPNITSTGVAIGGGAAPDAASSAPVPDADDPFAGIIDDASESVTPSEQSESKDSSAPLAGEGKPIPQAGGTIKKSLASSLYDLDDDAKGGE